MIPKIAHFIWFGHKRPPWVDNNIGLFRFHHPDWQVKLHGDTTDWLSYIPESLQKTAINAEQYCTRSDILSYSILKKEGGVYLDVDILTLRPIDALLEHDCFVGRVMNGQINCAVVGSTPNSKGILKILDECEYLNGLGNISRATFGPKLLSRLLVPHPRLHPEIKVFPYHYFYPFREPIAAHKFWRSNKAERKILLGELYPYLVHLWGVDGSGLNKAYSHGDALVYQLYNCFGDCDSIVGAEIGVYKGNLSRHLLRCCSNLKLYMVDRWKAPDPDSDYAKSGDAASQKSNYNMRGFQKLAKKRTSFADERRWFMRGESVEIAEEFGEGQLDFVFIDADHTYEGVLADLTAWYPKVRPGGLICGHDIDNPLGKVGAEEPWGVRGAVMDFMKDTCPLIELEVGAGCTFFFRKLIGSEVLSV